MSRTSAALVRGDADPGTGAGAASSGAGIENRSGSGSVCPTVKSRRPAGRAMAGNPGPWATGSPRWKAVAAARARSSAASFIEWPAWPLTHSNWTFRPWSAASSSFISSTLRTGLPSPFFQPLRFQPGIHLVRELITYCESQRMRSGSSRCAVERSRSEHGHQLAHVVGAVVPAAGGPDVVADVPGPAGGTGVGQRGPIGGGNNHAAEPSGPCPLRRTPRGRRDRLGSPT